MIMLLRLVRVGLVLVLALFALSFIVGLARPETGPPEKGVLALLLVLTFVASFKAQMIIARLQGRLTRI